jgi:two-component SAPR family response regulator
MPDINGIDTYRKMKEISPSIKAILTSGYTEDDTSKYLNEFVGFIQKPYHMQELQQLVYKILKS